MTQQQQPDALRLTALGGLGLLARLDAPRTGQVADAVLAADARSVAEGGQGAILAVTADHGNADCMWTEKNGVRAPMVSHTKNPVPFILKDFSEVNRFSLKQIDNAGLSNVAATILNLLGYRAPEEYDRSLITLV